MWLVTTLGFYSVVAHRDAPQRDVLIRARAFEDLDRLCELKTMRRYRTRIERTPRADYPFRLRAHQVDWRIAVDHMTRDIDYDNFKNAVAEKHSKTRSTTYMRVWQALFNIEHENREPEEYELSELPWAAEPLGFRDGVEQACTCALGGEPLTTVDRCPRHGIAGPESPGPHAT